MAVPGSRIVLQDRTSWLALLFSPIAVLLGLLMFMNGFSELGNENSLVPVMLLLLGAASSGFAAYSVVTARHRVELDVAGLQLLVSRGVGPFANIKRFSVERGEPVRLVFYEAAHEDFGSSIQLFIGRQHVPLQFSAPGSASGCQRVAEVVSQALGVKIEREA